MRITCVCELFFVLSNICLVGKHSYLAMLERIFQHSLVATFSSCSPYSSTLEIFHKTVDTLSYPHQHPLVGKLPMGADKSMR